MCYDPKAAKRADLRALIARMKGDRRETDQYTGGPGGGGKLDRTRLDALQQRQYPDLDLKLNSSNVSLIPMFEKPVLSLDRPDPGDGKRGCDAGEGHNFQTQSTDSKEDCPQNNCDDQGQ